MEELEALIHRSWIEMLVAGNYREIAALVVDGSIASMYENGYVDGFFVELPPTVMPFIENDPSLKQLIEQTFRTAVYGHVKYSSGNIIEADDIRVVFRMKLLACEDNWREKIKEQIVNAKDSNQAVITEKVFAREKKYVLEYNEMKFASQSEIRIAQELERRKVLFFPLPLAVRNDTGVLYKDHREVDFLVCSGGTWGILEVAFHPDRYEQDSEKDGWFKRSGILCIQHYTAERCYQHSTTVVEEFLNILKQHKK